MRSEFAQWLDEMQHIADKGAVDVQARHYDVLDFYFKARKSPQQAYDEFTKYLKRWNALTKNGRFTEPT
jgi:hypothetical protein